MSEPDFEPRLRALFAQPATFPDALDFQQRIRRKVHRRRGIRIIVLGTSGFLAGIVSVHALLASGIVGQLHRAVALLLKATDGFGLYWSAIAILLLLALALATNLDDDCSPWEGDEARPKELADTR